MKLSIGKQNEVQNMQMELSSGNYDIVASGQTFLFGKENDLTIKITADNHFTFSVSLRFLEEPEGNQEIRQNIQENRIELICVNFKNSGTGLYTPVKIAEIEGSQLYFMFWAFLDGEKKKEARSVRYTFFYEKR